MQFQREPVSTTLISEIEPLLRAHYKEIAHYQDIPLAPNFQQYVDADQAGGMRVYTARTDEKKLVGYSIFVVRYNPHYSGSLQAVQDILFVAPEHRHATLGARFIKWCDEQLKNEAVQVVYHHVKKAHDFGRLLERQGYELVDLVYGRRLD